MRRRFGKILSELAKKDNIKIKNIDEYKKLLNSQLL